MYFLYERMYKFLKAAKNRLLGVSSLTPTTTLEKSIVVIDIQDMDIGKEPRTLSV